jgi:ubiquitin C-terminal hydrolase
MLNPRSKLFITQFGGNQETQKFLIGVLDKMKEIEGNVSGTKAQYLAELKNFVKQDFIAHLSSGDTTGHLCSCQALFNRNFFASTAQRIVHNECQRLCANNALDFDEDSLEFDASH